MYTLLPLLSSSSGAVCRPFRLPLKSAAIRKSLREIGMRCASYALTLMLRRSPADELDDSAGGAGEAQVGPVHVRHSSDGQVHGDRLHLGTHDENRVAGRIAADGAANSDALDHRASNGRGVPLAITRHHNDHIESPRRC
jgi:hypothetical protein